MNKQEFSVSSWRSNQGYIKMHGQPTIKLIVPVIPHRQRNICCKTWHKKPGTEVCVGCHTLSWQFYDQWTDESWCVAPVCCLHTVVLGIVTVGILLRSIVSVVIVVVPLCLICHSTPFVPPLTDITDRSASSHKLVWYMYLPCWSQVCYVGI